MRCCTVPLTLILIVIIILLLLAYKNIASELRAISGVADELFLAYKSIA